MLTGPDATERAETLRLAIKRLTDAFTWGAMTEADYREQLRELQAKLQETEQAPDEQRTLAAIKIAQDIPI